MAVQITWTFEPNEEQLKGILRIMRVLPEEPPVETAEEKYDLPQSQWVYLTWGLSGMVRNRLLNDKIRPEELLKPHDATEMLAFLQRRTRRSGIYGRTRAQEIIDKRRPLPDR